MYVRFSFWACWKASPQTVFTEFVVAIRSHRVAMRMPPFSHSPRSIDALRSALKRRADKIWRCHRTSDVARARARAASSEIAELAGNCELPARAGSRRVWEARNNPTCKLKPVAGCLSGTDHQITSRAPADETGENSPGKIARWCEWGRMRDGRGGKPAFPTRYPVEDTYRFFFSLFFFFLQRHGNALASMQKACTRTAFSRNRAN